MGKIHINAELFAAQVNHINRDNFAGFDTANWIVEVLAKTGSNIKGFFHDKKDPVYTGEGQLAYLLDNYYEPAIKFTGADSSSLVSLLNGYVALVLIEKGLGIGTSNFDIWNGNRLVFEKYDYDLSMQKKRVWVWAMGGVAKTKVKSKQHHSKQHSKHHSPIHIF